EVGGGAAAGPSGDDWTTGSHTRVFLCGPFGRGGRAISLMSDPALPLAAGAANAANGGDTADLSACPTTTFCGGPVCRSPLPRHASARRASTIRYWFGPIVSG